MTITKLVRCLRGTLAGLWLLALGTAGVSAQTTTGAIRGTITAGGKVLAGAEILAKNIASGVQRSATSRADGSYILPGLTPASYDLTVRRIGSGAQTRRAVVQIGATQIQDFTLTEQAVQLQEIAVTAAP